MTHQEYNRLFQDYDRQSARRGWGVVVKGSDGNGELSSGEDYEQAHIKMSEKTQVFGALAVRRQEIAETIWQMNMAPQPEDHILQVQLAAEDTVLEALETMTTDEAEELQAAGQLSLAGLSRFADWFEHEAALAVPDIADADTLTVEEVFDGVMPAVRTELTEYGIPSGGSMSPTYALARLALRV